MSSLDSDISDAFGLLGVLLVFVIAYFSVLSPIASQLIEQQLPSKQDERQALASRLRSYRRLTVGFMALILLVGVVVAPLTQQVISSWSWRWPFKATRLGLLVVDVCLIGMLSAGIRLWRRLSQRIPQAEAPIAAPAPLG